MRRDFILLIFIICCFSSVGASAQTVDELMGKNPADDPAVWETRGRYTLRREVYEAFDRMKRAARRDGVRLRVVSAYRGFDRQKYLWERKWDSEERAGMNDLERAADILKYSSMPGTSRHHWGTDMDICSVEPRFFEKRRGCKLYKWLCGNAAEFDFFQPYTADRTKGYAEEKWHWSYRPLSDVFLKEYLRLIKNEDVGGFRGCHTVAGLDVVGNWVDL